MTRCPSCSLPLDPAEAAPSPVPGFPVLCEGCASAASTPIHLYFDTSEYSPRQIAEILGMFSDVYRSVGGDGLVIVPTRPADDPDVLLATCH